MARKRKPLPDDRIVALMVGGRTAEQITEILQSEGYDVSRPTVTRRMQASRGQANALRASARAATGAPAEDVPDELPEGAPLEVVDKWIPKVEAAAEAAEAAGDLGAFATLTAKLVMLIEHRRKAMPPPKADPNDDLDLRKLGAEVAKRLHRLAKDAAA
jgi:hypothetical protein